MPRPGGRPRHGGRGARCRWRVDEATWGVNARVERFIEPALLLLLRDGETHGYDLADALVEFVPGERIDLGNLYRLLRSLEEEGVVSSVWNNDLPGRSKRTYQLTPAGEGLLDTWADALRTAQQTIAAFVRHYDEGSSS